MPVAPFGGLNWQLQQGSNRSQIHRRKNFREECDNPVVTESSQRGLPTWVVIVTAVVAPILFGVLFTMAIDAGRLSDSEWRSDPNAGYTQAYTNEAIVFLYVAVQFVFLIVAPFAMTKRPRLRAAFWAIATPLCLLLSLIATIGQMAG